MRDHTKLRVFEMAENLALQAYRASRNFPASERFGLQSQIRRAAVSIAANIVEGCARSSEKEYVRFLEISYASSRELQFELGLCAKLQYLSAPQAGELDAACTAVAKSLHALMRSIQK
jgi:four helix bundle protein